MRLNAPMALVSIRGWNPQKLDALRRAKGWSWAKTSARTETPQSTLMSYVYTVVTPSPTALARIAKGMSVEIRDLIDIPDDVRLNDLRAYAGLTASALAKKINLSANYTSTIVRGEMPVAHPAVWGQALGVSEAEVLEAWTNSRQHLAQD